MTVMFPLVLVFSCTIVIVTAEKPCASGWGPRKNHMAWPGSSKAKYSGKNAKATAKAACESDSKCQGISCKVVIVVSVGIFQYTGYSC